METWSTDTHADQLIAETTSQSHPCPRCTTEGSIDFFDLVRGNATLHCPNCPTAWTIEIEAPMAHLGEIDLRDR